MELGQNENPNEITGFTPMEPGRYHVEIKDVDSRREITERNGKARCADVLTLRVLAGEVMGMEGKELRVFIDLVQDKTTGQFTEGEGHKRWAYAAGLLNKGQRIEFRPDMLRGCDVIVNVVKDDKGKYANVGSFGFDVWRVGDPDLAGVPTATGGDINL